MVYLLAVLARHSHPLLLVGHVNLVQRCVDDIPRGRGTLPVPAEHSIIGQPAGAPEFAGLKGDEAHVRQHVSHTLGVCLSHDGDISCKGGEPCHECPVSPDLPLAWGLWGGQAWRKSCQHLGQCDIVGEQFSRVDKLQCLNALYQFCWDRHNAACHLEWDGFWLGVGATDGGHCPISGEGGGGESALVCHYSPVGSCS